MMGMLRNACLFIIITFCFANSLNSQDLIEKREGRERFVRHTISQMSLRDMIGQLIIIGVDSKMDFFNKTNKTIDSLKVGGVCFFRGDDRTMIEMSRGFSSTSKLPLFIAIDAEWGLGMRLNNGYSFPRQIALGASMDNETLYEMGKNLALQAREMGININFAPTIDINTNPLNPVIGVRSFGQDKEKVAKKGWQYTKGMQDYGLLPTIKHFPGHGDTEHDSHLQLPKIKLSKKEIDTLHAYPFKYCIDNGAWAVMVGHLNIPSLTDNKNIPSSLSKEVIKDYLIDELGFKGLVITDALNMKGITNEYKDGRAEVMALKAGVDILLMPENSYKAVEAILKAIDDGELSKSLIEKKCKKILRWKYDLGLFEKENTNYSTPSNKTIENANEITDKLSQSLITFLGNRPEALPLNAEDTNKLVLIELGNKKSDSLLNLFQDYRDVEYYYLDDKTKDDSLYSLFPIIDNSKNLIISVSANVFSSLKTNYGLTKTILSRIDTLQKRHNNTLLMMFTNPYSLISIDTFSNLSGVLMCYENNYFIERQAVQAIFGDKEIKGILPVGVSENFKLGAGIIKENQESGYEKLAENSMDILSFIKIDSIANFGIRKGAYPGCQIVVIKSGEIVYKRNYGYLTYDSISKVNDSTIYDLASLTKVIGTTLAVMKLYEEGKIDLNEKISHYLPILKRTNKKKITIKQALSHCAGLKAWSPFYKDYIGKEIINPRDKKYRDEIIEKIIKTDLNKNHNYLYSDFGFILLARMVEEITNMDLDEYLDKNFYKPMGLKNLAYNPIYKFDIKRIAPTENDTYYRNRLIQGSVHDQTADLMGGVAGHAGLFGNAIDVASVLEMLLNNGEYKGVNYLKKSTIEEFNKRHFKNNRRGLGFDKPLIKGVSPFCSKYASQESYGHSGFTGTYFWSDPDKEISFVFLSNRVYPNANNGLLSKFNIRTDINDLIYESLNQGEETKREDEK